VVLIVAAGDIGKPRPAVMVQAEVLGDETTSVIRIRIPMSSDIEQIGRLRPMIEPGDGKGIHARSQVMIDKVVALGRSRIRRTVGRLPQEDMDRVGRSPADRSRACAVNEPSGPAASPSFAA
jgi:mRNA interferase MazF